MGGFRISAGLGDGEGELHKYTGSVLLIPYKTCAFPCVHIIPQCQSTQVEGPLCGCTVSGDTSEA